MPVDSSGARMAPAAGAAAEDLMPVPQRFKPVFPDRFVLEMFHAGALELGDSPALHADHVIVMRAVRLQLEFGSALTRSHFRHQAALLQQFDGPEDGGSPERRVFFLELVEDLLDIHVALGGEKALQDLFPLAGEVQSLPAQGFLKGAHDAGLPASVLLRLLRVFGEKDDFGLMGHS